MLVGPECVCNSQNLLKIAVFDAPPKGETIHTLPIPYERELWHCKVCGHIVNRHNFDMKAFYQSNYVDNTYGTTMLTTYEKIMALPPEKSDNVGRVERVISLAAKHFIEKGQDFTPRTLDIGSGLCVFLARLAQKDWDCTALDPDLRAVKHAQEIVKVNAVCADFITADFTLLQQQGLLKKDFDLITFNKVLEHTENPIFMLQRAKNLLANKGMIYVEVPDGELAAHDSVKAYEREEFHLEHWHAFSLASLAITCVKAGFTVHEIARLRDPSGKYTLWACLI